MIRALFLTSASFTRYHRIQDSGRCRRTTRTTGVSDTPHVVIVGVDYPVVEVAICAAYVHIATEIDEIKYDL